MRKIIIIIFFFLEFVRSIVGFKITFDSFKKKIKENDDLIKSKIETIIKFDMNANCIGICNTYYNNISLSFVGLNIKNYENHFH